MAKDFLQASKLKMENIKVIIKINEMFKVSILKCKY